MVLFISLVFILSSAFIKTSANDAETEKESIKTLSFNELTKDASALLSVDDYTDLIDKTIEQYAYFDIIELKENPWLEKFERFRIADPYCKTVYDKSSFDASKAKIITLEASKHSVGISITRDEYRNYLDDVYRVILTKLYYLLPEDGRVQYWPPLSATMNITYDHLITYSYGFDETKYTAQTFVDEYKKITAGGVGKFTEVGNCIQIDCHCSIINDRITGKVLFPTEEQQKVLDSLGIIR